MLFSRRGPVLRQRFLLLALAGSIAAALVADTVDYTADGRLKDARVDPEAVRGRYVPLSEVLGLIERQTDLKFVYDADRLPMSAEVVVSAAGRPSVASVLAELSGQVAVVFRQRNGLVAVWPMGPDDNVASPVADGLLLAAAEPVAATAPSAAPEPSAPAEAAVPAADVPAAGQGDENVFSAALSPAEPAALGAESVGDILQLEKFKVEGKAPANSQVMLRQKAAVAVDLVTSKDFSKFVATDVSDVVIRMPGFSTSSRGSFAVVRGLSERYNPIMLDGLVLPSSDPERQTPELDIFPTRLVDAVVVSKVFEPRLPATATGGAVDLRTRPLPEGRFAQLQFGLRADAGALGNDGFYRSDTRGLWDNFALGVKDRPGAPESNAERLRRAWDASANWSGQTGSFPLGARFSIAYEDRIDLGGEGRALGYSFSLGYESSAGSEEGRTFSPAGGINVSALPGLVDANGSFVADVQGEDYAEYEQEVRIGGLVNLGFAFNENHTLALSLFLSQIGTENVTRTGNGFSQLALNTVEQLGLLYEGFATGELDPAFVGINGYDGFLRGSESIYYRQRNLTDLKLSGEHKLGDTRRSRIEWSVANIQASQKEPDFSFLGYSERLRADPALPTYQILYGQPVRTPTRFWREVGERTRVGRLDYELTFDLGWMSDARLRAGAYVDATGRSFTQNAFYLSAGPASVGDSIEELADEVRESTLAGLHSTVPTPAATDIDRRITAVHVGASFPLLVEKSWVNRLELQIGARLERYQLSVSGRGTYGNQSSGDYYLEILNKGDGRLPIKLDPVHPLLPTTVFSRDVREDTAHPAAALTWSPLERLNLRVAWSRTAARPSLREIGPYFTNDDVTNEVQHGNVFLDVSRIENLDFRAEYFFPRSRDLVAVSVFRKSIEKPIEKISDVIIGGGFNTIGWFNNPNTAEVRGTEFEFAKNLGFLGEIGSWFTVGGNATWIDASVASGPGEPGVAGTPRRLYDQPEWIRNAWLTFDAKPIGFSTTVSWFSISDVLRTIELEKWSSYVESHSRLDLTMSQRLSSQWMLRFSAKNLTDPDRWFIADPAVATDEVPYRLFKDGRSYSLTASYDF